MSKRYGRNQKRAHLTRIVILETQHRLGVNVVADRYDDKVLVVQAKISRSAVLNRNLMVIHHISRVVAQKVTRELLTVEL